MCIRKFGNTPYIILVAPKTAFTTQLSSLWKLLCWAKRALSEEVDGKLYVTKHTHIWLFVGLYMYLPYINNWSMHGRSYGLDFKNKSRLRKRTVDSSMMKKIAT